MTQDVEVVQILAKYGGIATVAIVAHELGKSNARAWQVLRRLSDKGLVEKIGWGAYRLTPQGWAFLNANNDG